MVVWLRGVPNVDRKITVAIEIGVLLFLFIHAGSFHWLATSWHYIDTFRAPR